MPRSYQQYCGVAKALEVVGDRWTLLVVRELLIRGPSRYTDLRDGLPGVATNLLADRLKELEEAGIVGRYDAAPPIAATLYRLTPRGEALLPVIRELGRWGLPYLATAESDDVIKGHWIAGPVWVHMRDHAPHAPPLSLEIRTEDEVMTIETSDGDVRTRLGSAGHPAGVLSGPVRALADVVAGRRSVAASRSLGVRYTGDLKALRRLQPRA